MAEENQSQIQEETITSLTEDLKTKETKEDEPEVDDEEKVKGKRKDNIYSYIYFPFSIIFWFIIFQIFWPEKHHLAKFLLIFHPVTNHLIWMFITLLYVPVPYAF